MAARTLLTTPLGRLRLVSMLEGVSYAILMFVAMPLKYLAQMPEMVKIFGRIHGGLTVLFVLVLLHALGETRLGLKRAAIGFVASLIPLGAFWYEGLLRRERDDILADSPKQRSPR